MTLVSIDMTPQTRYGVVPTGLYDVTVHDLIPKTYKKGKNMGQTYYTMEFEIVDGPYTRASSPDGSAVGTIVSSNKGWMNRDLALASGFATRDDTGVVTFDSDDIIGYGPLVISLLFNATGYFTDDNGNPKPENVLTDGGIYTPQSAPPLPVELPF